jgi:hypothetical protein
VLLPLHHQATRGFGGCWWGAGAGAACPLLADGIRKSWHTPPWRLCCAHREAPVEQAQPALSLRTASASRGIRRPGGSAVPIVRRPRFAASGADRSCRTARVALSLRSRRFRTPATLTSCPARHRSGLRLTHLTGAATPGRLRLSLLCYLCMPVFRVRAHDSCFNEGQCDGQRPSVRLLRDAFAGPFRPFLPSGSL